MLFSDIYWIIINLSSEYQGFYNLEYVLLIVDFLQLHTKCNIRIFHIPSYFIILAHYFFAIYNIFLFFNRFKQLNFSKESIFWDTLFSKKEALA